MMNSNLFNLIESRVPGAEQLFLETERGVVLTYGDMLTRSAEIANVLQARGVQPGDRVAAQIEKSPEAVLLYLATLRAGAAFLPLNTTYTLTELEYFITDAEPALVVCDPLRREAIVEITHRKGVKALETLDASGGGSLTKAAQNASNVFLDMPRGKDDLAAILYTSGTTGRSKGAMLTHRNLVSNALTLVDYWCFSQSDVLLHALPIYHTHGLFVAVNTMLLAGGSMLFLPRFDADEVMRLLPRATAMMGVPTFYTRLLSHPALTHEACGHMRVFISGSAPLLPETHRDFQARTSHVILERYGMTETGMNASNPYEGERIAGTVGFPLPGIEIRVADPDTGRGLSENEIGVLEVKGPNVFAGYWRSPEKTETEFHDDFFITGDIGKIDERGYVHIVGRSKDLIITGGFNVYPREIESEIDALPDVVESAVIGCPHPDLGEGVTAIVVARAGGSISEASVLAALEGRLAKYKLPKRVVVVDALPRNTMGKVQKNVLRRMHETLYAKSVRRA